MIEVVVLHWHSLYSVKQVCRGKLAAEVGGYLELVPHRNPEWSAYCNEEGRLRGLTESAWSEFLREQGFAIRGNVHGDVVLCTVDKKGNDRSVSAAQKQCVEAYYAEHFEKANAGDDESS